MSYCLTFSTSSKHSLFARGEVTRVIGSAQPIARGEVTRVVGSAQPVPEEK